MYNNERIIALRRLKLLKTIVSSCMTVCFIILIAACIGIPIAGLIFNWAIVLTLGKLASFIIGFGLVLFILAIILGAVSTVEGQLK